MAFDVDREHAFRTGHVEASWLPRADREAAGDQQPITTGPGKQGGTGCQFETVGLMDQSIISKQCPQLREPWPSHLLQRHQIRLATGKPLDLLWDALQAPSEVPG